MGTTPIATPARKTKPAVLTDRIASFIDALRPILAAGGPGINDSIGKLWNDELRYHFDSGRTEPTITLYVAKYRAAIKGELGTDSKALAICNTKALKARLASFVKDGKFSTTGSAATIEERIERAEHNSVGRKPSLLLLISDFIGSLNGVDDEATMRSLWAAAYDTFRSKAPSTVISYITKYRNAVREAFGDGHPMLKIAAGDPALYDEAREHKMAAIAVKNGALVTFDNWKEAVALCSKNLGSDDPLLIAIGLIGVTGRRPFEIFTQAEFSPAKFGAGVSKWSVMFSGQAKTKERDGTKFGETYEIPVLAPATRVLDAYRRLRASSAGVEWRGMSSREFNDGPYRDALLVVRQLFEKIWPAESLPKPYGLRHLYGEIAYHQFAPNTVSKNSYLAAILGHNTNDLESSLSYMTFCLPENEDAAALASQRVTRRTTDRLASLSAQ